MKIVNEQLIIALTNQIFANSIQFIIFLLTQINWKLQMKDILFGQIQFKRLPEIACVYSSWDEKLGSIYISNLPAASSLQILRQYGIRAVVSVARGAFLNHSKEDVPNYLYLPADDIKEFDISQFFEKTNNFIQKNRKKGNVLVHCMLGKSRSAAIIIAYLIKKYGMTFDQSLNQIRQHRQCIKPNSGFKQILIKYEQKQSQDRRYVKVDIPKFSPIQESNSQHRANKIQKNDIFQSSALCNTKKDQISNSIKALNIKQTMIGLSKENDEIMRKTQNLKKKCKLKNIARPILTLDQIKAKCREPIREKIDIANPQN